MLGRFLRIFLAVFDLYESVNWNETRECRFFVMFKFQTVVYIFNNSNVKEIYGVIKLFFTSNHKRGQNGS